MPTVGHVKNLFNPFSPTLSTMTVENLTQELNEQQVELIVGGVFKDTSTGSWSISGPGPSLSDWF